MPLQFRLVGEPFHVQLRRNLDKIHRNMQEAIARTARKTASELRREIFKDIQASGQFGKPWKGAIKVTVDPPRGPARNMRAVIDIRSSSSPLGRAADLFEYGGTVQGKPLLWIPLNDRQSLRQAIIRAGGAVYVQRGDGKHLLIGRKTRRVIAVGVSQIRQRKRFHIEETIKRVASRIPDHYRAIFAKLQAQAGK